MLNASEILVKEIDDVLAEVAARKGTPNSEYVTLRQLQLMIAGVRDFMRRVPA